MRVKLSFFSPAKFEFLFFLSLLLLSFTFMARNFKVNTLGNLEVATKAWSDFSATIPIIRSFSLGSNFPPQYPLFAGPAIRYHFGFFASVGFLEKIGIPLDWALNSLSALSFFSLLVLIYSLGKKLFKKRAVGLIALVLFLFNGSLSFLEFFKIHPISLTTPTDIITNNTFPSFGPYDGKIVSAFWNLNIYTNQRHLALAYATFLALVFLIYRYAQKRGELTYTKSILLGILMGIFPFIHLAVFGMMGIALITFLIVYPALRKKIFVIGVVAATLAFPQFIYMGSAGLGSQLFSPGYLIDNLTLINFFKYWVFNLGLTAFLAPIGFYLAKKKQRKVFLPFIALFIVGNLFQFSTEISANHKFFNLYLIGANFFTAYALVYLWRKNLIRKFLVAILLIALTLSGIIDLFPIINDSYVEIIDIKNNKAANYIVKNTPRNSVFLNSSFLYDPASIAGRKIYLGWPYFAWSAGYDTNSRYANLQEYLSPQNKGELCSSLYKERIDYIEIQNPTPLEHISIDYSFFEDNFDRIYYDPQKNISIYQVNSSCKNG
ncbi:hypothetical protein IID22_03910 [Patescibacteria group bacterium]|nr:hypothetical protein [Patescibacteria group bacterium]